jgi:quercetin dioxygenase-like cupin family protein
MKQDVEVADFDWGAAGMRVDVPSTGCETFVVMDVTLTPGGAHDFHKHPDQDELIIVKSGRIVQWLEQDSRELGPGDSVYIDKDTVHGSFNDFDETAELQVILAPAMGEGGYELVDVAGDEPWESLR